MAFFGIFLVGILLWFVLIIIAIAVLFIFIPCLIIAIINLVKGVKNNWPKRNIIPLAITGSIALIFIILFTIYFIWRFGFYVDPNATSSSAEMLRASLFYFL
jgi:hypothetical protein